MARAKHQGKGKGGSARAANPSPRKQRHGPDNRAGTTRHGTGASGAEEAELRDQLHDLGLRAKEVGADGNCFFRAMCDQRWGDEAEHMHLRSLTLEYMRANRDDFEPFIEDDEKWDAYVERMGEDGTWAGNMELQAASLVCMTNICVHQAGQPRWEIVNFPTADRYYHVTYEGGDHYNSVELINTKWYRPESNPDTNEYREASGPISLIKGHDGVAVPGWLALRESAQGVVNEVVLRSGGDAKKRRAREVLRLFDGDVDAAATALRAEVSYRGPLKGGVGDPKPSESDAGGRPMLSESDWADRGGGGNSGTNSNGGFGSNDEDEDEGSEDDWEPVVTKRRGGGGRRGGRRHDDDLDERVAALRI